ncbi:MAG: hypothetical protein ABI217_00660 [Chthoniobacterales bacterium]
MRDRSANDGANDSQDDRPEDRYVGVHDRFGEDAGNESDENVPDEVKHSFVVPTVRSEEAQYVGPR